MRPLFFLPVALVLAATSASAQVIDPGSPPAAYICTPDSQVIRVTSPTSRTLLSFSLPRNKTTNVVPVPGGSDSSGITECVLGPDGLMYAARGYSVIRFPVVNPAAGDVVLVANTGDTAVKATGLAFNVDTLYVSTSANTVLAIGQATSSTPAAPAAISNTTGSGGVAFDIPGRLVTSSGTVAKAFAWPYGVGAAASYTSTPALDAGGVAVNTCGEVLVADKGTRTVKRFPANQTVHTFASGDIPQHIEVDAGNRLYIVTAQNSTGLAAKLWVADLGLKSSGCGTPVTVQQWVALSTLLSGPNKLAGLASSRGLGVAVEPSNVSITQPYTPVAQGGCEKEFHFGYHRVEVAFPDCSAVNGALKITAVKSLFGQVDFSSAIDPANEMTGMRYSAMGGHVVQYFLQPINDPNNPADLFDLAEPEPSQLPEFIAKYGFFTQEVISQPGVARHGFDVAASPFDQIVGVEFWDLGSLDPAGGERERDWSKRVVFNKTATLPRDCAIPNLLDNPLDKQNPLFNGPQNIKFAFTATGSDCANGTVRLSIARVFGAVLDQACNVVSGGENATYETQEVKKTNGAPGDNLFSAVGNSYQLNLDASFLNTSNPVAQFIATIWGDLAAPKNFCFQIQKQ